jgi:ribosomal protein S18 acetylase RimI-like enzyme
VRRAVISAEDTAEGRAQFSDVVGDLVRLSEVSAVIDTRNGLVDVDLATVALARLVPPSTGDELALEAILAQGWQPEETAELGGWRLRAAQGFTNRANSVLPLGAPGRPLDDALEQARSWYAERGLPLRLQLPVEARRLLDAELGERGWAPSPDVHVLAARLDQLPTTVASPAVDVEVAARPEDGWYARYRDGAGASPAARGILSRHPRVGFAVVRLDDAVAAIGRGTIDDDWLGVTAVEVAAEHRRRGLATEVMHALWRWGLEQGAVRSHLEVSSDNVPALALYDRLGYWQHHDYRYRSDPQS